MKVGWENHKYCDENCIKSSGTFKLEPFNIDALIQSFCTICSRYFPVVIQSEI